MAERSYWVGLPVGITVTDDGSVEYEIDTSEASSAMRDTWYESEELSASIHENQMLLDGAIVDSQRAGHVAKVRLYRDWLGPMDCPVRYACPFKSSQIHEMAAHIGDPAEKHGDV